MTDLIFFLHFSFAQITYFCVWTLNLSDKIALILWQHQLFIPLFFLIWHTLLSYSLSRIVINFTYCICSHYKITSMLQIKMYRSNPLVYLDASHVYWVYLMVFYRSEKYLCCFKSINNYYLFVQQQKIEK